MSRADHPATFADPSERRCAYYQDCTAPAVYAVPVERIGDGERTVVACQECAREHVAGPGRSRADLRELDASERWQADRGEVDTAALVMVALWALATAVGAWILAAIVVGWLL